MTPAVLLILTLAFAAVGSLLIVLAVPLMRRRIAPNRRYGLRVPATFADDWVWYEANARTGRDLLLLGAILIGTAVLPAAFIDLSGGSPAFAYLATNVAVCAIGAILSAVIGCVRAERLLKSRRG